VAAEATAATAESAGSDAVDAADAAPTADAAAASVAKTAATATATPAASGAASASATPKTFACGGKANPCPLEAWMKKNAQPAVASGETAEIAKSLEAMLKFAPPGYTDWNRICTQGITAAKAGDLSGAKAACRTCHDQYKKKYQAEMRDRKI
jgi:hypothetical protein